MKVLYLKDNYDISLKITVPDVAYLKRIKRANRFFVYIRNTPSFPPETDFHIFVRGGGINIWGGPAACFGWGLVATPGNAKEKV